MHHRATRDGDTWRNTARELTAAPLAWHVTMRPSDERLLVKSTADLRCCAGVMIEQGEHRGLLACGTTDNHAHALLATHRDAAGRFAHDVETSLRWRLRLPTRFEPARIRPVLTQPHLVTSFWYGLDQARKHALSIDPMFDGTCVPEILGARVWLDASPDSAPGHDATPGVRGATIGARVAALLPRVRNREVLALLGGIDLLDAPLEISLLPDAVAAAVGLADLRERGAALSAALCATAHLASEMRASHLADVLGVSTRCIQQQRREVPLPKVVQAIRVQWQLRSGMSRQRAPREVPLLLAPPSAASP